MRLTLLLIGQTLAGAPDGSSPRRPYKRGRFTEEETTLISGTTTTQVPTTTTEVPSTAASFSPNPVTNLPEDVAFPFPVAVGVNIIGITGRGRLIEEYNAADLVRTYGEDAVRIVTEQIEKDRRHDLFTPRTLRNIAKVYTPLGEIEFGPLLTQSDQTAVFEIAEYPELLIQFEANCGELSRNHMVGDTVVNSLIFSAYYGKDAANIRVAAEPIFVSPPAPLCQTMTGMCSFMGPQTDEYNLCRQQGGSLRYMLIPRPNGVPLSRFTSKRRVQLPHEQRGRLPFHLAMKFGALMIEALRKLHLEARVVHGAIDDDNWIVSGDEISGQFILTLRGFESSMRLDTNLSETPRIIKPEYTSTQQATQWMIDGHWTAPRDDVMRAIVTVSEHMNHPHDFEAIEEMYAEMGYEELKYFKMQSNIFAPVNPWDPTEFLDVISPLRVTEANKLAIRQELANILVMVRGLVSTNSVIPYEALITSFRRCEDLATNRTMST